VSDNVIEPKDSDWEGDDDLTVSKVNGHLIDWDGLSTITLPSGTAVTLNTDGDYRQFRGFCRSNMGHDQPLRGTGDKILAGSSSESSPIKNYLSAPLTEYTRFRAVCTHGIQNKKLGNYSKMHRKKVRSTLFQNFGPSTSTRSKIIPTIRRRDERVLDSRGIPSFRRP